MWPNITVEVERSPARWEASMISIQRVAGSLLGEIRWRTPSSSTSAAVPGVDPSPHSIRYSKHFVGRLAGALAGVKLTSIGE